MPVLYHIHLPRTWSYLGKSSFDSADSIGLYTSRRLQLASRSGRSGRKPAANCTFHPPIDQSKSCSVHDWSTLHQHVSLSTACPRCWGCLSTVHSSSLFIVHRLLLTVHCFPAPLFIVHALLQSCRGFRFARSTGTVHTLHKCFIYHSIDVQRATWGKREWVW